MLFCLWHYWHGLHVWFVQDDFAWLGVRLEINEPRDVLRVLFEPKAQGSIRPISERGFFLLFERLFGFNAFPWRAWVFLTQCANVLLLWSIARRLIGSELAGVAAAVFWAVNIGLVVPMCWTSAYNEVLLSCCFLGGFRLWLEYVATGRRRWLVAQWVTFILGFGVLELNVVYPALVAAHALVSVRHLLRQTVPMFGVSLIYAAVHRSFAPKAAGAYAMHWDLGIPGTLVTYLAHMTGLPRLRNLGWSTGLLAVGMALIGLALLAFLIWKLRRREWLALFCAFWLLAPLAPVLPLREHIMEYYITIPAIGFALLAGWAFAEALISRRKILIASAVLIASIYVAGSARVGRFDMKWQRHRTEQARAVIGSVMHARRLHPNGIIVIRGLPAEQFWAAIFDEPFRLKGMRNIYVDPESHTRIPTDEAQRAAMSKFVVPEAVLAQALRRGDAHVYDGSSLPLRNITAKFTRAFLAVRRSELPASADLGDPAFEFVLGDGWYPAEGGYRWMGKRGTLRLAAPKAASPVLELSGFALPQLVTAGGYSLQVRVNGALAGEVPIGSGDASFVRALRLPSLNGAAELRIDLDSSRAAKPPGDARELAVAFGRIAVR